MRDISPQEGSEKDAAKKPPNVPPGTASGSLSEMAKPDPASQPGAGVNPAPAIKNGAASLPVKPRPAAKPAKNAQSAWPESKAKGTRVAAPGHAKRHGFWSLFVKFGFGIIVLAVVIFGGWWLYSTYLGTNDEVMQDTTAVVDEEPGTEGIIAGDVASLVARIQQHVVLPSGETATTATAGEREQLQSVAGLLDGAKETDHILLFREVQRVVVYDSERDIVVNIDTVSGLDDVLAGSAADEETDEGEEAALVASSKILILNGTSTTGLAGKIRTQLEEALGEFESSEVGNAASQYTETVVYVADSSHEELGSDVAQTLTSSTTPTDELPAGEDSGSADIVVILGTDAE